MRNKISQMQEILLDALSNSRTGLKNKNAHNTVKH